MTRRPPRGRDRADRPDRRVPYWISYGLTAGLLMALTAALVLIVLPSRYALVADLRESGFSFPTSTDAVAFPVPERETLVQPRGRTPAPERAPTPTERLWNDVDSLLAIPEYGAAIARMETYLERVPDDVAVLRARARTLAAAGRPAAARAAFEEVARRTGDPADRLAVARLLRDAGETDASAEIYRDLLRARPDDAGLRHELARLYLWSGRYPEAVIELRRLVEAHPREGAYRLDLARALYWGDRPAEARAALADMPADAPESAEASALDRELARLLAPPPEPEPVPPTLPQRAREAVAAGDLPAAARWYDAAVAEAPGDSALARERVDFLQFRRADQEAAIAALEAYDDRFGLDAEGRYRLAQLYAWTGRYPEATAELERLLAAQPRRADAWGLLGDVRRYEDDRGGARKAYDRALSLDASEPHATAGLVELDRLRDARIAARDPIGIGPGVALFTDSDDFLSLDLGAGASWTAANWALGVEAGFRRLEGFDLSGLPGEDEGGYLTVEAARWWSEAAVRTALRVGVDHLDVGATEPIVGASIEKFTEAGGVLSLRFEHGPAYPLTYTLESVIAEATADQAQAAVALPVHEEWTLSAVADATRLAVDGSDNLRLGAGLNVARRLGPRFTLDVSTRVLGFTDPAPASGRRLYWDPSLFWANTAGLTLANRPETGLGYRLRLGGGAAWSDERDATDAGWIPQMGLEAGLSWRSGRTKIGLDVFYNRGREDEYESGGGALTVRVAP